MDGDRRRVQLMEGGQDAEDQVRAASLNILAKIASAGDEQVRSHLGY